MKGRFRALIATTVVCAGLIWIAVVVLRAGQRDPTRTAAGPTPETLQRQEDAQRRPVVIDNDDIGGVVTSAKGPEAGVWVIAETTELPTRFAKIVVTNERGQYLIPDVPKANYNVWVRGYGLVDSAKVKAAPGKMLDLKAVVAPNPKAAAQYYPAGYWISLLNVPDKSEFPGKGGSGVGTSIKSQDHFLGLMKTGDIFGSCMTCHQLGDKATREIPNALGTFGNLGRNALRGPGSVNIDVALSRIFKVKGRYALQIRAEAFNLLNHANFVGAISPTGQPSFSTMNTNLSSSTYGQVEAAFDPRLLQFAMKLSF
jgi:hypothetical protein